MENSTPLNLAVCLCKDIVKKVKWQYRRRYLKHLLLTKDQYLKYTN